MSINDVSTAWPSSSSTSSSTPQLLGLFPDGENMPDTMGISVHSRAMFKAAVLLSQQYNITINGEYLQWQAGYTGGQMIDALSGTCQAVSAANILGIVGPALSREALLIAAFVRKIGIPVVSYAATDPDLSDRMNYRAFYRTVPSDNAAAFAIAKLFMRYNWTSCVIIHQNDAIGIGGAKIISQTFVKNRLSVNELIVFDIATLRIRGDLKKYLTNSPTRIVVAWLEPNYTSIILQEALAADVLGPHFIWILSSDVPVNAFEPFSYQKLVGMLAIEPVTGAAVGAPINSTLLNAALSI